MKKFIPIILSLALVLCLAACGKDIAVSPDPAETNEPNPTVSEQPEVFTNPLTGETVDEKYDNSRPIAVMINNIEVALPHCGTSQADILYEVLAEGNITRMLAVFSDVSAIEKIGSMRSARPYYIELALSYDAIYVHAGGSEQAYSDIKTKNVSSIDGVRTTFKADVFSRDKNRMKYGYEHSLFTSGTGILAGIEEKDYELKHDGEFDYGINFAAEGEELTMTDSQAASTVDVSFGGIKDSTLTYDSSTGLYTFSEYKKDITDGNNGEHLTFKNVLVLYADTKIIDDYGRRSVDLEGTGTGLFICNGKAVSIKWEHDGTGEPFRYFANNKDLTLSIGKSYIAVVPSESTIGLS